MEEGPPIAIVVAVGEDRTIGKDGDLPWHLPAELQHFKRTTMGKPIVMGRNTHESIGTALPGRTNIVVTSQHDYEADGCVVVHSIEEAIERAATEDPDEVMIIGGASIYQQVLDRVDRLYLTVVHDTFDGDVFFPPLDGDDWHVVSSDHHRADDDNPYDYTTLRLARGGSLPTRLHFLTRTRDDGNAG
mgnify:CR=1 FL=1